MSVIENKFLNMCLAWHTICLYTFFLSYFSLLLCVNTIGVTWELVRNVKSKTTFDLLNENEYFNINVLEGHLYSR